jgi:hypothetical protein
MPHKGRIGGFDWGLIPEKSFPTVRSGEAPRRRHPIFILHYYANIL